MISSVSDTYMVRAIFISFYRGGSDVLNFKFRVDNDWLLEISSNTYMENKKL